MAAYPLTFVCLLASASIPLCASLAATAKIGHAIAGREMASAFQRCWTDKSTVAFASGDILDCSNGVPMRMDPLSLSWHRCPGEAGDSPVILEEQKMMICSIPKVASTKFKELISRVLGWTDIQGPQLHKRPFPEARNLNASRLNQIVMDNEWLRVAFLRDPVERFFSAYADKIVNARCLNPGYRRFPACSYDLTSQSVQEFLKSDPSLLDNGHFALQMTFCGFEKFSSIWNRVALYRADRISDISERAFEGRLHEYMSIGWGDNGTLSMWQEYTINADTSGGVSTLKLDLCCKGKDVLQNLQHMYQEDYDFFKLPKSTFCDSVAC